MNRVAIVGPDFAPSSLPPATRIRFFAKHLPEFGWDPIILTAKPEFYDWPVDGENERLLPKGLKIIRTDAWRPGWTRRVGFSDIGIRSIWHIWTALKQLCQQQQIDLVFIPVPPYLPMVLGRMAQKRFGVPYVIDYIDPWVTEYYWGVPKSRRPPKWPLAYAMARVFEPFALKKVSHITGVSKGTTDSVIHRYSWLSDEQASEIPYGAEADDFVYVTERPRQNRIFDPQDGLLHMSYVGACIPGMHPAVRALFEAVQLGLKRNADLFSRLRLHFVGTSYGSRGEEYRPILEIAQDLGLENQVDETPRRVSYLDSLQVMLDSNALVLLGSDEAHYTASKIFPYLLSKRPLLAVFHKDSSVNQIIGETTQNHLITFSANHPPAEKVEEIFRQLQDVLSGSGNRESESTSLEQFTTRAMTRRLARSFDRVLLSSRPVAAVDEHAPKKVVTKYREPHA